MIEDMTTSHSSSKHKLFWNGVDGLIQIQKKNSNLNTVDQRKVNVDAGISPCDFKVC